MAFGPGITEAHQPADGSGGGVEDGFEVGLVVDDDVFFAVAGEIGGDGGVVGEAAGDFVNLPGGLGFIPIDLDIGRLNEYAY